MNEVKTKRGRRRWPWLVPLLLGLAGVAGAVVRNRMTHQAEPGRLPSRPAAQPNSQYRDQVATGRSPTGNGVVRAERPSAGTD
ncbi:MAG: hypothetical protein M3460_12130 [Actinomycetota bacterium]|nr:hypothetical protein [Actinomycetota bacterium]